MILARFVLTYVMVFLFCGILSSCSHEPNGKLRSWMQPNGKVKVLSTTAMIDDLVKRIGGEQIDSLTLIEGELDPHSYQLVKGDDDKLSFARVIFYNGLGLEHGASLAQALYSNPRAVPLGDLITKSDPSLVIWMDGQLDPHIWMDISLWMRTIPFIVDALSKEDPQHSVQYRKRGDQLQQELKLAHEAVRQQLQRIPDAKRYLVTSHDAFNYFTRAYLAANHEQSYEQWQRRFAAPEGLSPDSQLSPIEIQKLLDHLLAHQIHVLFPESNVSRDSIRKIVQAGQEKDLHLTISDVALYGDAMGRPGSDGDTYLKMIQHNANTLEKHLRNGE